MGGTRRYDDLRARRHMADLIVAAETCVALGATEHQFESFPGRDIALGALTVTRVLPVKGGAWLGPSRAFRPADVRGSVAHGCGAHPQMGL